MTRLSTLSILFPTTTILICSWDEFVISVLHFYRF